MSNAWHLENLEHTRGEALRFKKYLSHDASSNHDHCQGCWKTIIESGENAFSEGYTTSSGQWICPECFANFKNQMNWTMA
ncbi:MAG: hypothetical protein JWO13_552 [Acidobacteriales bacterium]|nr:hypothetical protein [Terriglobales bacterium]